MRSGGARHDAILFDFDGVLVDSEPVHFACWREILRPFGIPLQWADYAAHCIGVSDRAMIDTLVRLAGRPEDFEVIYARYPEKKALFRERMLADPPMPASTKQLLEELKGLPLAVVTSSGRAEVEPILAKLGVLPRLAAAIYGDQVKRLKPDPEPYLMAAARLGCKAPLVVEDSEAGCASGRAAGFEVLRVRRPDEVAAQVRQALRSFPTPAP